MKKFFAHATMRGVRMLLYFFLAITLFGCPDNADDDGDGLTNEKEKELKTNPNDKDTDKDGLEDGQEVNEKTNPLKEDTDGDGFSDKFEVETRGLPPNTPFGRPDPTKADTDGDGIPDGTEWRMGSDINNPDQDNDGVQDGRQDRNGDGKPDGGRDTNNDGKLDGGIDSDGDGIADWDEINGWTDASGKKRTSNPIDQDTDGDLLTDGEEKAKGTDPNNEDSDGDMIIDGREVFEFIYNPPVGDPNTPFDPYNPEHTVTKRLRNPPLDPNKKDTDGDGKDDGQEIIDGTNPTDASN